MCNPRRVSVVATAELEEAWEHVVRRTVELRQSVTGEARVSQGVGDTLPEPVLASIERAMADGTDGWRRDGECYRRDVPGGYALYDPRARSLEIVATLEGVVEVSGTAEEKAAGIARGSLRTEGTGSYYDDGYGGGTEASARQAAEEEAKRKLEDERQRAIRQQRELAEQARDGAVSAEARARAEEQLARDAEARRADLSRRATEHLQLVGTRCRQHFNGLAARAWGDAISRYVAAQGGSLDHDITESDGTRVISFTLP